MAPVEHLTVEWQTQQIIKYLFEDEDHQERSFDDCLEVDSGASDEDAVDLVIIADKLKHAGDEMMKSVEFRAAVDGLTKGLSKEAMETVFSRGVDAICKTHVCQQPEVSSEMQLINASVAVGLYLKESAPELKNKIQEVMRAFINRRMVPWLSQKGGWGNVS